MSRLHLSVLMLLIAPLGCGGDGPTRYEISGTVTYNGQPTPAGQVTFSPDVLQQNSGPGAFGIIKDGKYSTYVDRGAVGGPHHVTITGYNAMPGTVPEPELIELFPIYETTVDLPHESTVQDFEIPSQNQP